MNTKRLPASAAPTGRPTADRTHGAGSRATTIARGRGAILLAASACLALLLAACSGAGPTSNGVATLPSAGAGSAAEASASPTPNPSDQYAQILAYSQCMRTHGITDFPDPQTGPGGGVGLQIRGILAAISTRTRRSSRPPRRRASR